MVNSKFVFSTFVSAVPKGTGSADGAWPFFQGVCAAA